MVDMEGFFERAVAGNVAMEARDGRAANFFQREETREQRREVPLRPIDVGEMQRSKVQELEQRQPSGTAFDPSPFECRRGTE